MTTALGPGALLPADVLDDGTPIDDRRSRLAEGADGLAGARAAGGLLGRQRILLTVAASLMTAGVALILLGWLGASHSLLVEQQVPYLISGGLLGLAFVFVGAVTLLAHWLTVLVQESRAHEAARRRDHEEAEANRRREHEELLAALQAAAPRPARRAPSKG